MNQENGNQKVFELAPIKTPEQQRIETAREQAPKARRNVYERSDLSMSAKGFFGVLVDYTFLSMRSGNGCGRLFTNTRELSRWLKHDEDSIGRWTKDLIDAGVLWVRRGVYNHEYRICAMSAPPEQERPASEYQRVKGRAFLEQELAREALLEEGVRNLPTPPTENPGSDFPRKTASSGSPGGQNTSRGSVTFGSPHRKMAITDPDPTPISGGKMPIPAPADPPRDTERSGSVNRNLRTGTPKIAGSDSARSGDNKETPMEIRSLGDSKGDSNPPLNRKAWEKRLGKLFPPELQVLKQELLSQQKQADQADNALIADFSQRIEAIDIALYGGKRPVRAIKTLVKPVIAEPKPLTQAEILESARGLVALGKQRLLSEAQKLALAAAGK